MNTVLKDSMEFWLPAFLLAAFCALVLMWGSRSKGFGHYSGEHVGKLAIYRDQFSEIDRDLKSGLLPKAEAEAQRTEVGRRLLAASREVAVEPKAEPSRQILIAMICAVVFLAVPVYLKLGQPKMLDVPRVERLANAEKSNDLLAMSAKVEDHLAQKPKDLSGWQILIPSYVNLERYDDAANATARVMELSGPTAELYANFAEFLTLSNKGLMSAQAVFAINEALKLDANLPKARYYHALGLGQDGKVAQALAEFNAMLSTAAPDAPWRPMVKEEISRLEARGVAPKIGDEQINSASSMAPEDRMAMIRGMVNGLDEKLKVDANDLEGWLRLIRARTVLNESEKAKAALATATNTFKNDANAMAQLQGLAKEMNLQ